MKKSLRIPVSSLLLWAATLTYAQQPLPLNQLILKGTHNSYACCGGSNIFSGWSNSCPVMHNPPSEQIDDWNVWALELDFSTKVLNGVPTLIVGHDGPTGDESFTTPDWGSTLQDYLERIRSTTSFSYHPIIIYFNHKTWGDNAYNDPGVVGPILEAQLIDVFGVADVFGQAAFLANGSQWPTVPQLAGKLIPYTDEYSGDLLFSGGLPILNRWYKDTYTDSIELMTMANSGQFQILSIDQYQLDWTFDFTAPPNPVYVKNDAPQSFQVVNAYGHDCLESWPNNWDITNTGNSFWVGQHGTFRFPYDKINESVNKAFSGWTLLIHTGTYPEKITINKPLTLKAEGGPVIIGN